MSFPAIRHRPTLAALTGMLCLAAWPTVAAVPTGEAELPSHVDEASGLTYSGRHGDLLWTHNDNINDPGSMRRVTPFLYGIGPDGAARVRAEVAGVTQRDWEAVESTRLDDEDVLVVADSGDNRDSWPDYVLWFLAEPNPRDVAARVRIAPDAVLRYRYPDGPADTEAMAVDTVGRQILLLTKRQDPPRLFTLPLSTRQSFDATRGDGDRGRVQGAAVYPPRPSGPMGGLVPTDPINWLLSPLTGDQTSLPTDMSLSADGHLLAVLTYASLYFFRREAGQTWAEAIRRPVASRSLPRIDQWEGLALSPDGHHVSIVREGSGPGTIRHLEIPEAARRGRSD